MLVESRRKLLLFNEDGRYICFDTPGDRLSRDRAQCVGRKRLWLLNLLLGEPCHFTHLDDDIGERQSAQLLRCDSRLYRDAKHVHEFEEPFVVPRDVVAGYAGNGFGGVFHLSAAAERKASPLAPGDCPVIEADRKCGLVATSRSDHLNLVLNLAGSRPSRDSHLTPNGKPQSDALGCILAL